MTVVTRKRLVWSFMAIGASIAVSAAKLPSGYTELEYIQATGNQYIDTGCTPSPDFRAVVDFQHTSPTEEKTGFGYAGNGNGPSFRFWRRKTSSGMTYLFTINDSYKVEERFQTINVGVDTDTDRHVVDLSNSAKYLDGVQMTNTSPGLTQSVGGTMYLFADRYGWSPFSGHFGTYRIFSCKLYESGALIRQFVPCTDENGKGGLYDIVGGQMYYNTYNNTDFILGPAKTPSAMIIIVQ